jgi:hypothetical protein
MPAKSEKQKQFMDAAAHNPKFAKAAGVPVSVAKEFSGASKGMKFGKGSDTSRADLQKVNKPKTLHGKMSIMKEGGDTMASKMNPGFMAMIAKKKAGAKAGTPMKKGGMPSKMGAVKTGSTPNGVASKGKTKGKMVKMNMGGKAC